MSDDKQLDLTAEAANPPTWRYKPAEEGPSWQIEEWRALSADFSLPGSQVEQWHQALACDERPWTIVRRIYQVAPLFGDELTDDDDRPWTFEELAKKWGVPVKALKSEHQHAIETWKRISEEGQLAAHLEQQKTSPTPVFKSGPEIPEDELSELLDKFRFNHYTQPRQRNFIGRRIFEMRAKFDTPVYRETARQIVIMELAMETQETILAMYQAKITELQAKQQEGQAITTELTKVSERFETSQNKLTTLTTKHKDLLGEIGADEEEQDTQVNLAIQNFNYATEAMIRYYEKGDRELLDGVHTGGEILFLLSKTSIRDFQQYRPDIVTRIREALLPENLWKDGYNPSNVPREACRRLKKICDMIAGDDTNEETIPLIDNAPDESDDDEFSGTNLPIEDETPEDEEALITPAAGTMPQIARPQAEEADFVVATQD